MDTTLEKIHCKRLFSCMINACIVSFLLHRGFHRIFISQSDYYLYDDLLEYMTFVLPILLTIVSIVFLAAKRKYIITYDSIEDTIKRKIIPSIFLIGIPIFAFIDLKKIFMYFYNL